MFTGGVGPATNNERLIFIYTDFECRKITRKTISIAAGGGAATADYFHYALISLVLIKPGVWERFNT